jgi:hypothetical protein
MASSAWSAETTPEAWKDANLDRLWRHQARHEFASLMIAAGANAKALSSTGATQPSRSHSTATVIPDD